MLADGRERESQRGPNTAVVGALLSCIATVLIAEENRNVLDWNLLVVDSSTV